MEDSGRKISRLAVMSLTVSTLWLVLAFVAASSMYWYPWQDPQGWDKLGLLVVIFWGSITNFLASTIAGVAALWQIGESQGRTVGRSIALAGIGVAVLPAGFIVWALY